MSDFGIFWHLAQAVWFLQRTAGSTTQVNPTAQQNFFSICPQSMSKSNSIMKLGCLRPDHHNLCYDIMHNLCKTQQFPLLFDEYYLTEMTLNDRDFRKSIY